MSALDACTCITLLIHSSPAHPLDSSLIVACAFLRLHAQTQTPQSGHDLCGLNGQVWVFKESLNAVCASRLTKSTPSRRRIMSRRWWSARRRRKLMPRCVLGPCERLDRTPHSAPLTVHASPTLQIQRPPLPSDKAPAVDESEASESSTYSRLYCGSQKRPTSWRWCPNCTPPPCTTYMPSPLS